MSAQLENVKLAKSQYINSMRILSFTVRRDVFTELQRVRLCYILVA
jgi:hypothetical protein